MVCGYGDLRCTSQPGSRPPSGCVACCPDGFRRYSQSAAGTARRRTMAFVRQRGRVAQRAVDATTEMGCCADQRRSAIDVDCVYRRRGRRPTRLGARADSRPWPVGCEHSERSRSRDPPSSNPQLDAFLGSAGYEMPSPRSRPHTLREYVCVSSSGLRDFGCGRATAASGSACPDRSYSDTTAIAARR